VGQFSKGPVLGEITFRPLWLKSPRILICIVLDSDSESEHKIFKVWQGVTGLGLAGEIN
jgi:hypothetical protein